MRPLSTTTRLATGPNTRLLAEPSLVWRVSLRPAKVSLKSTPSGFPRAASLELENPGDSALETVSATGTALWEKNRCSGPPAIDSSRLRTEGVESGMAAGLMLIAALDVVKTGIA